MAYIDKLARLIKLAGILGLSLSSFLISACGGRSPSGNQNNNHALPDGAFPEAGVDAGVDAAPQRDARTDAAQIDADHRDAQPPDADLWDVICE